MASELTEVTRTSNRTDEQEERNDMSFVVVYSLLLFTCFQVGVVATSVETPFAIFTEFSFFNL